MIIRFECEILSWKERKGENEEEKRGEEERREQRREEGGRERGRGNGRRKGGYENRKKVVGEYEGVGRRKG